MYLDYLSLPCPCWILFADRRPTLALGLLSALSCYTCLPLSDPACVLTMSQNKALHMDPHVSRLVRPVTPLLWPLTMQIFILVILKTNIFSITILFFNNFVLFKRYIDDCFKSSQVTFIYIALLTMQIVSKQLYSIK